MTPTILILSILLGAAADDAPPSTPPGSFSWCLVEGTEPGGRIRYFSEPFETDLDGGDARVFLEYVEQAYLHRRGSGYATACTSYATRVEADAALGKARSASTGAKIVTTGWRARFE